MHGLHIVVNILVFLFFVIYIYIYVCNYRLHLTSKVVLIKFMEKNNENGTFYLTEPNSATSVI